MSINEHYSQLHALLKELTSVRDQLKRAPGALRSQEAALSKAEQVAKEVDEFLKKAKVEAHEKETSLKALEGRIRDLNGKLNLAQSNKEYSSLQEEIKLREAEVSQMEEEILELLGKVDEKTGRVSQARIQVEAARKEFDAFKSTQAYTVEKLTGRVGILERAIADIEQKLVGDAKTEYQRMVKTKGVDSLSSCSDGVCDACFTTQTTQTWSDVCVGKAIKCKTCGALLYRSV